MVLVYTDKNASLPGSLAPAHPHMPVAHVEAGLRSFTRKMPEEIHCLLTDHAITLQLASTETAMQNIMRKGTASECTLIVGDVICDACPRYSDRVWHPEWFSALSAGFKEAVLVTVHRTENTDDPKRLTAILEGLANSGWAAMLAVYPRTSSRIDALALPDRRTLNQVLPVGILEIGWLEKTGALVATDSSGDQKAASFHGRTCVTLSGETAWWQLVDIRASVLVGACAERTPNALAQPVPVIASHCLFGTGHTAEKTRTTLVAAF